MAEQIKHIEEILSWGKKEAAVIYITQVSLSHINGF